MHLFFWQWILHVDVKVYIFFMHSLLEYSLGFMNSKTESFAAVKQSKYL